MAADAAKRVLITGGAGFVGSCLAVRLVAGHPDWKVVALDNLRRRGSELNLPRLRAAGVEFVHGDIRERSDLLGLEPVDALVECSAEPSALAGVDGSTDYVVNANLLGAYNCLELARRDGAQVVFLSTSRVYPHGPLNELRFSEAEDRFELDDDQPLPGASAAGIAEEFPLDGPRTLYGATKLAAEVLITEFAHNFGLPCVINRCGVIAGPWQMGKVDQGVFTYWMLAFYFRRPLSYIGYGGTGKQVRDLLHVEDLGDLIDDQLTQPERWAGRTFNVGGGREVSLSLRETTELCRELTGNELDIGTSDEDRPGDVRVYISDASRIDAFAGWRPRRSARDVMRDIYEWVNANEAAVRAALVS
jgi:CDP-paratose 2-epimerase